MSICGVNICSEVSCAVEEMTKTCPKAIPSKTSVASVPDNIRGKFEIVMATSVPPISGPRNAELNVIMGLRLS
jgi:hypothetical protein